MKLECDPQIGPRVSKKEFAKQNEGLNARHASEWLDFQVSKNHIKGGGLILFDVKGVVVKRVGRKYKGWG